MRGVILSFRHELMLVSATMLAAAGWMFSHEALAGLPPLLFIGARFLLAGLVVFAFGKVRIADLRAGGPVLLLPGLILGVAMSFWIYALAGSSNLGVGSFISGLGTLLAPVAGLVLFRWPINRATWAALALATCGMGFLFLKANVHAEPADWLFLAAALGFSLNFVVISHLARVGSTVALTVAQLVVAGLVNLVLSAFIEQVPNALPGPATIAWMLASILLATSLRFFVQIKGQAQVPVSRSALVMSLEPVWTAMLSSYWLGSSMSLSQSIGCGLIFAALLLRSFAADTSPAAVEA